MKKDTKYDFAEGRERLRGALDRSERTMRSVSLGAGSGHGYLNSILNENKEPGVSRLANICAELGVSLSYVLYGIEITSETEEIIQQLEDNPAKRDGIISILNS